MNDEPIFTKCGRELYEKKCVFWVTVLTSQKKHPVNVILSQSGFILEVVVPTQAPTISDSTFTTSW